MKMHSKHTLPCVSPPNRWTDVMDFAKNLHFSERNGISISCLATMVWINPLYKWIKFLVCLEFSIFVYWKLFCGSLCVCVYFSTLFSFKVNSCSLWVYVGIYVQCAQMCTSMRQTLQLEVFTPHCTMWTCNIFMQDRKRVFFPSYTCCCVLLLCFFTSLLSVPSPDSSRIAYTKDRTHRRTAHSSNPKTERQNCQAAFSPVAHSVFCPLIGLCVSPFTISDRSQFFVVFWYCMAMVRCKLNGVMVRDCIGLIWLR